MCFVPTLSCAYVILCLCYLVPMLFIAYVILCICYSVFTVFCPLWFVKTRVVITLFCTKGMPGAIVFSYSNMEVYPASVDCFSKQWDAPSYRYIIIRGDSKLFQISKTVVSTQGGMGLEYPVVANIYHGNCKPFQRRYRLHGGSVLHHFGLVNCDQTELTTLLHWPT